MRTPTSNRAPSQEKNPLEKLVGFQWHLNSNPAPLVYKADASPLLWPSIRPAVREMLALKSTSGKTSLAWEWPELRSCLTGNSKYYNVCIIGEVIQQFWKHESHGDCLDKRKVTYSWGHSCQLLSHAGYNCYCAHLSVSSTGLHKCNSNRSQRSRKMCSTVSSCNCCWIGHSTACFSCTNTGTIQSIVSPFIWD